MRLVFDPCPVASSGLTAIVLPADDMAGGAWNETLLEHVLRSLEAQDCFNFPLNSLLQR
jgi:hypothetical protein